MNDYENERRSLIASTMGGVMTDEAGAVTGELEVSTRLDAGALDVRVRYAGSDEWYTVTGSPIPSASGHSDPVDLHERVVEYLVTPGKVVDGNEEPASLQEFPA